LHSIEISSTSRLLSLLDGISSRLVSNRQVNRGKHLKEGFHPGDSLTTGVSKIIMEHLTSTIMDHLVRTQSTRVVVEETTRLIKTRTITGAAGIPTPMAEAVSVTALHLQM